jgi:hypothetical protein
MLEEIGGAEAPVAKTRLVFTTTRCTTSIGDVRQKELAGRRCALTTMARNAVDVAAGGLEPSPFLLEKMATPHVPRGVAERPPINVRFFVKVKRGNPLHSASS